MSYDLEICICSCLHAVYGLRKDLVCILFLKTKYAQLPGFVSLFLIQLDSAHPRLLVFSFKLCSNAATVRASESVASELTVWKLCTVLNHPLWYFHTGFIGQVRVSRGCEAVNVISFTSASRTGRLFTFDKLCFISGAPTANAPTPPVETGDPEHCRLLFIYLFIFVCRVYCLAPSSVVLRRPGTLRQRRAVTQGHVPDERSSSSDCGHGGPLHIAPPHLPTVTVILQ